MKKIAILITLFFIAALVINPFYTPKYQVYHILEKENANSFIEEVQEDDATFILSYYNRHSVCEKWRVFLLSEDKSSFTELFNSNSLKNFQRSCVYDIKKYNNDIMDVQFCLTPWAWSGECFWLNMYYDMAKNIWKAWAPGWVNVHSSQQDNTQLTKKEIEMYYNFVEELKM